jgi:hypothetical protein
MSVYSAFNDVLEQYMYFATGRPIVKHIFSSKVIKFGVCSSTTPFPNSDQTETQRRLRSSDTSSLLIKKGIQSHVQSPYYPTRFVQN